MTNDLASRSESDLVSQYAQLSDDALLQLRIEGGLTAEADKALQSEMQRRSLGQEDVDELKGWEDQQNAPPPDPQQVVLGYGIRYVGKKSLTSDDESRGIFVATKFIVLRGMPVIPMGSYRIKPRETGLPEIESRVAVQWDQVCSGLWPWLSAIVIGIGFFALTILFGRKR